MAQWDQVSCPFGPHDSGQFGGGDHRSLRGSVAAYQGKCLGRADQTALGHGPAGRGGLVSDIDHMHAAAAIQMGQGTHGQMPR